ncbi:MAG: IPT/TIG domain-containing protein [Gammaproteobacteria bacterium]
MNDNNPNANSNSRIQEQTPIHDRLDFPKTLEQTRAEVWSLLHFAVSDANKDVAANRPDLIEKALPGLQKKSEELTELEIANLFMAYNELSQLVYPATVESLWLKRQIEEDERQLVLGTIDESSCWHALSHSFRNRLAESSDRNDAGEQQAPSPAVPVRRIRKRESAGKLVQENTNYLKYLLYGCGVIIIVLQAYNLFLSYELETVEKQKDSLAGIEREITSAYAGILAAGGKPEEKEAEYPLREHKAKKLEILQGLTDNYCVLWKASVLWPRIFTNRAIDCGKTKPSKGSGADAKAMQPAETGIRQMELETESRINASRDAFFTGATVVQRILNYLVLPTLLGSLGALAFVIRDLMKNYADSSYVIGSRRNRSMRNVLGPLLGLISGIIAYPSREAFTEAAFSPLVFGFLMGYSVEFAFSLFDTLIAKGKSLLPEVLVSPKQAVNAANSGTSPQVFSLEPNQGLSSGGGTVTIGGSGFSKDAKVNFGSTAAIVNNVEETRISAIAPPGEGTVNVAVQTPAGTSLSRPESQYTYQDEPSEDEGKAHGFYADVKTQSDALDENLPSALGENKSERDA